MHFLGKDLKIYFIIQISKGLNQKEQFHLNTEKII